MLNIIYYPISFVMRCWHWLFGQIFSATSGISWVLSIIFLVVTIRLLLIKPMMSQMRSARKMQEIQPMMQELRTRYKNDQQQLAIEMRKLQKEQGFNPLASCLPMLVQIPIFLGLFHVLRSFDRTGTRTGELGMTVEQTRNTPNYAFSVQDVQSFLDTRFLGTPLSAYISMDINPDRIAAYGGEIFTKANVMIVAIPLIIICASMTHFTAKASLRRNEKKAAATKKPASTSPSVAPDMTEQMQMMSKMMVWVMPIMIVFTGVLWQVGLLIYMTTNNLWTYFQQHYLFAKMDNEEADELEQKKAKQKASAPKPGAKPTKDKK